MENLKDYLLDAKKRGYALGAFNLDSMETLKAVVAASQRTKVPVLVEASPGEADYLGMRNLAALVDNAKRELGIPLFLNLDHADDLDKIEIALDFGFDLIHFDGSKLPLEDNLSKTKQVVSWCHKKDILVEGEIDPIGEKLTDPLGAKGFVEQSGVDIFAVSLGNKHGMPGMGEDEKLDLALLQKIREALPETPFSLHGGSGITVTDIREAIKLGVVKINVNTELRLAWREGLETSLGGDRHESAWYKLAAKPIEEVSKVAENKMKIFYESHLNP